MRRIAQAACFALAVPLVWSCFTGSDPLYCDEHSDCEGTDRPLCDFTGELEGSGGLGRTCVATETCSNSTQCTTAAAPICVEGQCLPCSTAGGDSSCETLNAAEPICSVSGACVACADSLDCPAGTPICQSNSCVTCGEAEAGACSTRDNRTPICAAAGPNVNRCVECDDSDDCSGSAPVCAPDGFCAGCTEHSDCDSLVCDRESGECVATEDVVYADKNGTNSNPGCGAAPGASACDTLVAAIGEVSGSRVWVKMADGTYTSAGAQRVNVISTTLKLVGTTQNGSTISAGTGIPVVQMSGGATVLLDTLRLSIGGNGVDCSQPGTTLVVRHVTIEDANDDTLSGDGILSAGCSVTVKNSLLQTNDGAALSASSGSVSVMTSTIFDNNDGGLEIDDSSFVIQNNFVHDNGGATATKPGVTLAGDPAEAVFLFNTIYRNERNNSGPAAGVVCNLSGALEVSSNIVWANDRNAVGDEQVSGNCTWNYSVIQDGSPNGEMNQSADPLFLNEGATPDLHLQPTSPAKSMADPNAVLDRDVDGETRPMGEGRDIGADEITE